METINAINRVTQLGIGTGIRSMTPVAFVSWAASSGRLPLPGRGLLSLLSNRRISQALVLAAVGESIADKVLPLPSRTSLPSLTLRVALGGFLGATVFSVEKRPLLLGAGIGALAAVWGAFAGHAARMRLTELGGPDVLVATIGDVQAISLAMGSLCARRSAVA
ncbi:MAG: hypothetical protein NVSMB52_02140 [Chloroflexota bacterium]